MLGHFYFTLTLMTSYDQPKICYLQLKSELFESPMAEFEFLEVRNRVRLTQCNLEKGGNGQNLTFGTF